MLKYLRRWGRDDIADFIEVALHTGCRRRELLSAQSDQLKGDWLTLWTDQTRTTPARAVPLTPHAKCLLQSRLPWHFTPAQLRYWFDKVKEAMGLVTEEGFVLHACRHTCATRLVEAGVNLRVIQRWFGHKSIATTERYAKCGDDMLLRGAASLYAEFPPQFVEPTSATRPVSSQKRRAWEFSTMVPHVVRSASRGSD
jgi:integrase